MSAALELIELLDYTDHERKKWEEWFAADPQRFELPFHGAGRFPTLWSLLDHVFLVERRHLSRLQGSTPPDSTGVPPGNWKALFDYAELVRADLRRYLADLDATEAQQMLHIEARSGTQTMTKQRLAAHIMLHEIRHTAQLALAARLAGHEPPGRHDIFYFERLDPPPGAGTQNP